jgi:hypothetical protein
MGLDPLLLTRRDITLGSISVGSRTDFEGGGHFGKVVITHT